MLRFARAAALAAMLAVWPVSPALAERAPPAAAVSAETELLAQEMVRLLFSEVDFTDIVQREMVRDTSKLFDDVPGRPEWPRLMRESMLEEADAMKPLMSRLLGKAFARYLRWRNCAWASLSCAVPQGLSWRRWWRPVRPTSPASRCRTQ